jgi:hypothetical protein
MSSAIPLTEEDLHDLYIWVDEIPLSKPKRNIARDFSDGTCVAEVLKHYFPKLVELHNFASANATKQKIANWNTLNARVLRKLHFEVPMEEIQDIVAAVPGAIERFLRALRTKITQIKNIQEQKMMQGDDNGDDDIFMGGASSHYHPAAAAAPPVTRPVSSTASSYPRSSAAAPRASAEVGSRGGHQRPAAANDTAAGAFSASSDIPSSTQGLRQLLEEKDRTILELRESISLLTDKVGRMEDLLRVKDEKIMRYKQQLGR